MSSADWKLPFVPRDSDVQPAVWPKNVPLPLPRCCDSNSRRVYCSDSKQQAVTEKTRERQRYKSCEGTQLSVQFLRDLSVGVCDDGIKSRLLV